MGKDLLRPLQICLSKLRGSGSGPGNKVYEVRCNDEKSSWIFSCKHPRTESLSLAREGEGEGEGEAAESVYKCYNSLYIVSDEGSQALVPLPEEEEEDSVMAKSGWCVEEDSDNMGFSSKCSSDSSNFFSDSSRSRSSDLPPGLASGLTSERFFFSPGRSNSILEEANSKCPQAREKIDLLGCTVNSDSDRWDLVKSMPSCYDILKSESIAVYMNSPNPYHDFRISMQEMVEAHNFTDWESLQEMLICYLTLNHKRTHSFILGAFADLVGNIINAQMQTQTQIPLLGLGYAD